MQEQLFDKDLGLDLLINPRKKANDNMSSSSRIDLDSDVSSVKSIRIRTNEGMNPGMSQPRYDSQSTKPMVVNVMERPSSPNDTESSDTFSDDQSDQMSQDNYYNRRPPQNQGQQPGYNMNFMSMEQEPPKPRMSDEEILNKKREILYQFDRMEKKGMRVPRKFTLASNLEEMEQEYERLKRDREIDGSVKYQRKVMMTLVSGIELANNYFDPIGAALDGWSDNVNENIDDYDDVFEELHEKYKDKAKVAPEIKLLFMLGGSAFMYHMTNKMFKSSSIPGLDQVLKQNPELMRQVAAATAQTMQQDKSNPVQSGLGGLFSNIFNSGLFGGGGNPQEAGNMETRPQRNMRGPTNIDDILKEIDDASLNDEQLERLSSASESNSYKSSGSDESASGINKLLMNKKKNRGKKITLDL